VYYAAPNVVHLPILFIYSYLSYQAEANSNLKKRDDGTSAANGAYELSIDDDRNSNDEAYDAERVYPSGGSQTPSAPLI